MIPASKCYFTSIITRADGTREIGQARPNLRTTAGTDWQSSVMSNTAAQPAAMNWLALSSDTTAPAAADTALTSEYTTNGLSRAQGTYAHTAGTNTNTVAHTFTCSANSQVVNKEALFNAAGPPVAGTMGFESAEPTPPTLNTGDTLTQSVQLSY